jgi:hypothetical protein
MEKSSKAKFEPKGLSRQIQAHQKNWKRWICHSIYGREIT